MEMLSQSDQSPPPPPPNEDNPVQKMVQRLFEQEEQMERMRSEIEAEKTRKRLEDEMQKKKSSKVGSNENDQYYADEITIVGLGYKGNEARKPLFKNIYGMKETIDEEEIDQNSIVLKAHINKIIIVSSFIIMIFLITLLREYYWEILSKPLREALRQMLLDSFYLLILNLIIIILYYNNFFDGFYLIDEFYSKMDMSIRLIEIDNLFHMKKQELSEIYYIDIFSILLYVSCLILMNLIINTYYLYCFHMETLLLINAEANWNQRKELATLLMQQLTELKNKEKVYKQIMSYPNPPPQLLEIKSQIIATKKLIQEGAFTIEYLCLKSQFLCKPPAVYPYMGPISLRDDFNFADYLTRAIAQTLIHYSKWTPLIIIFIGGTCIFELIIIKISLLFLSEGPSVLILAIIINILSFNLTINMDFDINSIYLQCIPIVTEIQNIQALQQSEVMYPKFATNLLNRELPYGPKNQQEQLFKKQSSLYVRFLMSLFQKMQIQFLLSLIALVSYYRLQLLYTLLIIPITIIVQCLTIRINYISLLRYCKISKTGMLREQDLVRNTVLLHKIDVIKATTEVYELIKYLNMQNRQPLYEGLMIQRSFLLKQIIESLMPFQNLGKSLEEFPNLEYDEMESKIIEIGISRQSMGSMLPADVLRRVVTVMGPIDISENEMIQIMSFCKVSESMEQDYFCPIRLLLFIQLRIQEVKLNPMEVIMGTLSPLVKLRFSQVKGVKNLINSLVEIKEEEEEGEDEIDSQSIVEEQEEVAPGVQREIDIKKMIEDTGEVDLDDLNLLLDEYEQLKLISRESIRVFINELNFLARDELITTERIAQFIRYEVELNPR